MVTLIPSDTCRMFMSHEYLFLLKLFTLSMTHLWQVITKVSLSKQDGRLMSKLLTPVDIFFQKSRTVLARREMTTC